MLILTKKIAEIMMAACGKFIVYSLSLESESLIFFGVDKKK